MISEFLSNTELYFSSPENILENKILIRDEEANHIAKVMRHNVGDKIYVTNGIGKIFLTEISSIEKNKIESIISTELSFNNKLEKLYFVIPKLKNPSRFEFAIEKSVELGITNFIIYNAEFSLVKGEKLERWNKILLSAMKQSLRSYLPKIELINKLKEIHNYTGKHFVFEQKGNKKLNEINLTDENHFFIFGPEGGFSEDENKFLLNFEKLILNNSRLRAETAIVTAAGIISEKL